MATKISLRSLRIGDLGRVVTGKTPPTVEQAYYGGDYPFITPTDISDSSIYPVVQRNISESGRKSLKNLLLPSNTVCFTCIASIGKICITNKPSFTNQQINSIIVNENDHDYRFIFYLLKHYTDRIKAQASGAATPIISKSAFSEIVVQVPYLCDQKRIASVLMAYDNLIENNARRIAILEEMSQAIYREWFVNFRYSGHEGVRLVESEMEEIPEGWRKIILGDICEEVRRNVLPESIDSETPYFGLEHLPRRSLALSEWGTAKEVQSTKLAFKKREILFGKIRPYFHKVGPAPVEGVCSSDAIVIRPLSVEYFSLVLMTTFSDDFVAQATQTSQGTKMPRANWEILKKYSVNLPPEHVLRKFNEVIENIVSLIENLVFRNRNLRQQRGLLLPRLISGELEVKDLDIVETN